MPQLLFGGMLAVIMLGFYIWAIIEGVKATMGDASGFTPNMSYLLNTIGGLISATVVGVLGATEPGYFPAQKAFERNLSGTIRTVAGLMPSLFIFVWIGCGVAMVIYGFVLNDSVAALSSQAKVWLGTAIGAVYAYMGIKPQPNGS